MPLSFRQIRKLPQLARIAFAARCARRVVGLFEYAWPDAPKQHVTTLNQAVELAEELARTGNLSTSAAALAAAAINVSEISSGYAHFAALAASSSVSAADAAACLVDYDYAYTHYYHRPESPSADVSANAAYSASNNAVTAASKWATKSVKHAQESDLRFLIQISDLSSWDDYTPVPPEIFGPLWPDGPPKVWPIPVNDYASEVPANGSASDATSPTITVSANGDEITWPVADDHPKAEPQRGARLDVTLDIPAGVDDETAQATVRELYDALNELHVASGGSGLVVEDYQSFVEQFAEVKV